MKCAYCNGPCDDRPVSYEAVCWDCWRETQKRRQPMKREWWWQRRRREAFQREQEWENHPWNRSARLAKEGDWRGVRFLQATEQLAEIENAIVQTFNAAVDAKGGPDFIGLVHAIEWLYEHECREAMASVSTNEREA